jgi:glycosyltransferase involved in cell wall biosynthesis
MQADTVMMTQAVDEEDPVLGFTPGWINALARHVGRLSVYCLREGKCDPHENVSLHVLGEGRLRRLWRLRKGLNSDLKQMKVRGVFAHMCPKYAVVARRILGPRVPVILWYAQWASSRCLTAAHNVAQVVLTPAEDSCPIRSNKVRVVGHGIDTEKFKPVPGQPRNGVVLLSAGRMALEKRFEFLIEALAMARKEWSHGDITLRILGSPCVERDHQYLSELKRLVRERNLENAVEFRPAVPYTRVEEEYANCDVFVSTTVRHSFDKAPLEAMACGKIVLTTNQSFLPVLREYSDALIADDAHRGELARRMIQVARMQPSEREKLGLALRQTVVRDHSLERLMEKVGEIVNSL